MNNKTANIDKLIKNTGVKIKAEEREKEGKPLLKVRYINIKEWVNRKGYIFQGWFLSQIWWCLIADKKSDKLIEIVTYHPALLHSVTSYQAYQKFHID